MGNARWAGVRVRDILARAGLNPSAKQVQFHGLDEPVLPATPPFRKSLDVEVARGDNVIIAYLMNGEPMPRRACPGLLCHVPLISLRCYPAPAERRPVDRRSRPRRSRISFNI